jgi:hypothetical protein
LEAGKKAVLPIFSAVCARCYAKADSLENRGAQERRNFRQKNCASKKTAVVELVWEARISEP